MAQNNADLRNCKAVTVVVIMFTANCKMLEEIAPLSLSEYFGSSLLKSHSNSWFVNQDAKFAACGDRFDKTHKLTSKMTLAERSDVVLKHEILTSIPIKLEKVLPNTGPSTSSETSFAINYKS